MNKMALMRFVAQNGYVVRELSESLCDGRIEIKLEPAHITNDFNRFASLYLGIKPRPSKSHKLHIEPPTESEKEYNANCKVIFADPATILLTPDGEKFISKANNEKFDEEKGLLMCLAKDNGVSHIELKKMLDRATRVKPKPLPPKERKSLNGKSIKKGKKK